MLKDCPSMVEKCAKIWRSMTTPVLYTTNKVDCTLSGHKSYFSSDTTCSVFGLYILVNLLRFRGIIKGYRRTGGVKDLFGLLFPSASGTIQNESQLKYYCMNCGKEHREIKCTYCGSKMKKDRIVRNPR